MDSSLEGLLEEDLPADLKFDDSDVQSLVSALETLPPNPLEEVDHFLEKSKSRADKDHHLTLSIRVLSEKVEEKNNTLKYDNGLIH